MDRTLLSFYGTQNDLDLIFMEFEQKVAVKYFKNVWCQSAEHTSLPSLRQIGLGTVPTGDIVQNPRYYALTVSDDIKMHYIQGSQPKYRRFEIHHEANPRSIYIIPSGFYGDCLIRGEARASSLDPVAEQMLTELKESLTKYSVRIRSNYVGKGAAEFLDNGTRLVSAIGQKPLYDLKR